MRRFYTSLLLLLLTGVAATTANAQRKSIATISQTAVASANELVSGKTYIIKNNSNKYLHEEAHTCTANGNAAGNTNNKVRMLTAAPVVGSTDMAYVFTVNIIEDTENNTTYYTFKGQTGYIDNVDHDAGTYGDPIHMTEEACTYTLVANGSDASQNQVVSTYNGTITNNSGTLRTKWDYGSGADNGGLVLTSNPSGSSCYFSFYEVTLGTDYSIQSLEEFVNGQKVLIANISTHSNKGYLYETESHTCDASQNYKYTTNRITTSKSLEAPSMTADNFSNYVFEVEISTDAENNKTFAFKTKTGYIDNVDGNANTPAHGVHVSDQPGTFTLTWNASGYWVVKTTESKSANGNETSRLYWNVGGTDGGGLTLYSADGNEKFMFYAIPTAKAKLTTAEGIDNIQTIATFSAPYAAVIPAGVEAWYIDQTNAEGNVATMKKLEGEAIPANEGVILTGIATGEVNMAPASYETVATISGNKLSNTAAETHTAEAGDYVLAIVNSQVAFYPTIVGTVVGINKAYLHLSAGSSAVAMNFGDNTTAVNTALETLDNAQAPVFDLSGRRVMQPVKGGLYIQNGKKFIVK